jgi:hypothetical protein
MSRCGNVLERIPELIFKADAGLVTRDYH